MIMNPTRLLPAHGRARARAASGKATRGIGYKGYKQSDVQAATWMEGQLELKWPSGAKKSGWCALTALISHCTPSAES